MGPCVGDMWSDKISILCNVNDMKPIFKAKVIITSTCVFYIRCYIVTFFKPVSPQWHYEEKSEEKTKQIHTKILKD